MNPNRQNNCYSAPAGAGYMGRPGVRPSRTVAVDVIGAPCCSDVQPAQVLPCCSDVQPAQVLPCGSDVISGGIIIGTGNRGCDKETVLSGLPIAMAYVPWQSYTNLYPMNQALRNGTLFRELDLDFAGRRCN